MLDIIYKMLPCVVEKGNINAIFSTPSEDRTGDIVTSDGWNLENFRRNPVLLWQHDRKAMPVGKVMNIGVRNGVLMGDIKFAGTAMGQDVEKLMKDGMLNGFSVGFLPTKVQPSGNGVRYLEKELIEISVVTVPDNAEALVQQRSFEESLEYGEDILNTPESEGINYIDMLEFENTLYLEE